MPVSMKFGEMPKTGALAKGDYPAIVQDLTLDLAKDKENYNLVFTFEFTGQGVEGRTLKSWKSLKQKVAYQAYEWLVRLGGIVQGEDLTIQEDPKSRTVLHPNVIGNACMVRVGIQADNPRYNEIEDLFGPEGEIKPTPAPEVSSPSAGPKPKPTLR